MIKMFESSSDEKMIKYFVMHTFLIKLLDSYNFKYYNN